MAGKNQLGRRNLTDEERTFLYYQEHDAEKMIQGTNNQHVQEKSEKRQNGAFHKGKTSKIIAKRHGIGSRTVERAVQFGKGVDTAEARSPGGMVQPPQQESD